MQQDREEQSDGDEIQTSHSKKSSKKREHDSDSSDSNVKVQRLEGGEVDDADATKSSKRDESDSENVNSKKDDKDKERDRQRARDRDNDKYRDRDGNRSKDKRRRDHHRDYENDPPPPANFERYWGAGPKRNYYRDDRRRDDDYNQDRYQDRDRSREYGRGSGRKKAYSPEKVGPRYYGGKDDDQDKEESRRSSKEESKNSHQESKIDEVPAKKPIERKTIDMLTSKTGGAYIPPARLRMMQAEITDKSSAAYQRLAWEALKKSIHGHINKINTGNLAVVIRELLKENLVRGCGLLCRSIIQAQSASPTFTRVFAALVAVINSRFPQIGELLLKRVIINFKRGFKRQDKASCISSAIFIAHLVNQGVAHELLALEILVLLVETPTSDSVEVAIAFLKEVVDKLLEVAKKGTMAIQDMLRNILHEGTLDKRVQYIIETMFQIIKVGGTRKLEDESKQKETEELMNLVEEEDQITHILNLDDAVDPQNILDVFKEDPKYEENEAAYKKLLQEILGSDSESGEDGSDGDDDDSDENEDSDGEKKETIIDNTETNLVALRRTIYLTIQSSLDFEECAHKLMRMQLKPGQEMEMCHMILDCCAEMRTYEKFFGLLAQRFCMINKLYVTPFQQIFCDSYSTVHRLEINKLRNVAKFFAHLLHTDAISWEVLSTCRLTEEDSTSSSRIFIKILFQELSEYMGLPKLNNRVKDPTLQLAFDGLFPRDDPKNTRFAINFFTSIGLGGLTDELREHLKTQPRTPAVPLPLQNAVNESSSSSSSSDSSSSSSSSSDSSSDDSSESEKEKKKKKKLKVKKKGAKGSSKEGKESVRHKGMPEREKRREFDSERGQKGDGGRRMDAHKSHRIDSEKGWGKEAMRESWPQEEVRRDSEKPYRRDYRRDGDAEKDRNKKDQEMWRDRRGEDMGRERRGEDMGRERRGEDMGRERRGENMGRDRRGEDMGRERRGEDIGRDRRDEDMGRNRRGEDMGKDRERRDDDLGKGKERKRAERVSYNDREPQRNGDRDKRDRREKR